MLLKSVTKIIQSYEKSDVYAIPTSKVAAHEAYSFVVYFSDHGDDVFDTQDFVGHYRQKGSKPMFDIPFLAWFSEDYLTNNKRIDTLTNYTNRKYNTENFIYSFSDLINTKFEGFDDTKSLFSPNFKANKRIIKDSLDYDYWN